MRQFEVRSMVPKYDVTPYSIILICQYHVQKTSSHTNRRRGSRSGWDIDSCAWRSGFDARTEQNILTPSFLHLVVPGLCRLFVYEKLNVEFTVFNKQKHRNTETSRDVGVFLVFFLLFRVWWITGMIFVQVECSLLFIFCNFLAKTVLF